MSDNAAGSVNIDIKGNVAPFEAALAKARQMADLFDSQVSQKLGGNSATEAGLAKIAAAVDQTNAMLAKLTAAAPTAAAAVSKLSTESTKASSAITGVGTSSAVAAVSVGKLAAEANTVAASIQRAVAANGQFAASNLQLASGGAARAEDIQAYGAALDDIRAKYNPLFAVTRQYLVTKEEIRIANKLGAISEIEAATAVSRERQETLAAISVLKGHTSALQGHGAAAGLGATQTMALVHATRSFTEQLLLGVSPLQALTAQMNHLTYVVSGPGGPKAAFSAIGSSVVSVGSKIASFVAGSAILRSLGVAGLTASLGFEAIRDSASEAEHRTVGFGETFHAIFQTIGNDIRSNFGTAIDAAISPITYALKQLGSAAVDIAELVINSFHAAFTDIVAYWSSFPDQIGAFFVGAANNGIGQLDILVKAVSDSVDKISAALNNIPGVNIPLLNAPDQAIAPIDNKYLDNLKKAIADRNAAVEQIMKQTPLRNFASDVVDQIATNHALEDLNSLKNIKFDSATGSANGFSSAVSGIGKAANGVTVEFGGMSQQVINVSRAFQDAKLSQLGELQQTTTELHTTQAEIKKITDDLKAAPHAAIADVFGDGFAGNASAARDAIDRTVTSIDKLFNAYDHGNGTIRTVNDSLDLLRQTLLAQGGDPVAINAFFDSIVSGEIKVRQLNSTVSALHENILALPNKTVTITVRTQQVGSGTQSLYDVGGGSTVGVTRYGGVAGQQSGPSITSNEVPRTSGYGSMGGSGDLGSTNVNVTRFATGGMIHPGDTQNVSFFKSPDETVGIFTPGQMQALADPQSGFTGTQPTANDNRMWTVQMNIEANTQKTAQLLDDIKTSAAASSSALSGSSGGSYSGTGSSAFDPTTGLNAAGHTADQVALFNKVFAAYQSNYQAARATGGGDGIVGYGSSGLAASPQEIAANIAYGGMSPVGFDTGGQIAPGDTQQVSFFKNPNERVIIARPDQFTDARSQGSTGDSKTNDSRPITFNIPITVQGGAQVSNDSVAEMKRQFALALREGMRSINGR